MGEAFCLHISLFIEKSLQIYPCPKYCNFRKEKKTHTKIPVHSSLNENGEGFLGDFPLSQQPKCTISYNGFLGRMPREAQAWEAGKEPEAASRKGDP